MASLDKDALRQLAQTLLQQQGQDPAIDMEVMEEARRKEAERNRIREMANIGSSIAEGMTGAQRGHRLGLDDTAKQALQKALQRQQTGGISDKDKLFGALNLARDLRLEDQFERSAGQRDVSLGQGQQKIAQSQEKLERPSDVQVKEVAQIQEVLSHLKDIRSMKQDQDTGPVSGRQNVVAQMLGIADPVKSKFAAAVGQNLADYIMQRSGLTVSDKERVFLKNNTPQMNDQDDVFTAKLDLMEDWLQKKQALQRKAVGKQGKDASRLLEYIPKQSEEGPKKDPKIQDYADKYFGGDYAKAEQLLRSRGYGK